MADSPGGFFYSDEDVFIGKKRTEREAMKRALMGLSCDSPMTKAGGSSTSHLPDVINISSDKQSAEHKSNVSSSQNDDDVIIIDSDSPNNSVQIISDDEADAENKDIADKERSVETSERVDENNVSEQETGSLVNWKTLLKMIPDPKVSSKESECRRSSGFSINALIEASQKLEEQSTGPVVEDSKFGAVGNLSYNDSIFTSRDYSLTTGESESVLDISHGSSLPSLPAEHNESSLGLLTTAVYEDISFDGDHVFDNSAKQPKVEVDLHMSVDETDHIAQGVDQNILAGSGVAKTPLYKSCLSELSNSVYTTANNTENFSALNQPSSAFSDYRDAFDDSLQGLGMDNVNSMTLDDKKTETSFEIVTSNCQNSFTNTVVASTKTENAAEKSKLLPSKLPVYNSASNILKPSTLQANIDSKLMARNFKWAKTLPKPNQTEPKNTTSQFKTNKTPMKKPIENVPNSKQEKKTPAKNLSIKKPTQITTPCRVLGKPTSGNGKTPCKTVVNKMIPNITSSNKTPDKGTLSQPSNLPKSDIKTPKGFKPPVNQLLSSGKRNDNLNQLVDNGRYKNVISPVRAYINNAPIAMMRKVHVPEEQILLMGGSARKAGSQIPKPTSTPVPSTCLTTTGASSVPAKSTKVAQRLVYKKLGQNQENMDPNPNYARDTLPTKILQAAAAVFMKEPEPPKRHLPKIGESMQKLIDTPRPKVTVHQGRVKESPRTKGVLIPSVNIIPSTPEHEPARDSRISIRVVKSAEHSNN